MQIKILGGGCEKCKLLEKNIKEVMEENGINSEIQKIVDTETIMEYDILSIPALVIDEKVVFSGSVPNKEQLTEILCTHCNPDDCGGECKCKCGC